MAAPSLFLNNTELVSIQSLHLENNNFLVWEVKKDFSSFVSSLKAAFVTV